MKDRKNTTTVDEWQGKVEASLSERCLVLWLKDLIADEFEVVFHIMLVGREHDED